MLQRVLRCAVIIGSSHSFCPTARSVCQYGISSEPADAVGDDALVPTSETPSTSDITAAAASAMVAATIGVSV